jgi:hypothetical protein
MLNTTYTYFSECCPNFVTRKEFLKISLGGPDGAEHSMQALNPIGQGGPLRKGKVFHNTHMKYCCGVNPCAVTGFGFTVEMDGQIVTDSDYSCVCPCLGPYPVRDGLERQIGNLDPKCYAEHCFNPFSLCLLCCAELAVKDSGNNNIYTIKRENCTCLCCTEWKILGLGGKDGSIKTKGCPFYPQITINMPNDKEENKRLLLSSLGYLP